MSTISVTIPNSLYSRIREIAQQENIAIEQFVASALAEKIAALLTEDYLKLKAERGNRKRFEEALESVPDVAAEEDDRLDN